MDAATGPDADGLAPPPAEAEATAVGAPQAAQAVDDSPAALSSNQHWGQHSPDDQGATCFESAGTAEPSAPLAQCQEDAATPGMQPAAHSHASFASPADKPFLGGFRNRHSGAVFHHAASQTVPPPQQPPSRPHVPRVSAGAQTDKPRRSHAAQCGRDATTQCPRPGWAEGCDEGRVVELPSGRAGWPAGTCAVSGLATQGLQ